MEFGGQLTKNEVDYKYSINDTTTVVSQNDKGFLSTVYLQDKWDPIKNLSIIGGIRATHFDVSDDIFYEPRLSISYQLNNQVELKGAWGKY